jgi:hypothetical protein
MGDRWRRDCQIEVNSLTVVEAELTPRDDVALSKAIIENIIHTPQSYEREAWKHMSEGPDRLNAA